MVVADVRVDAGVAGRGPTTTTAPGDCSRTSGLVQMVLDLGVGRREHPFVVGIRLNGPKPPSASSVNDTSAFTDTHPRVGSMFHTAKITLAAPSRVGREVDRPSGEHNPHTLRHNVDDVRRFAEQELVHRGERLLRGSRPRRATDRDSSPASSRRRGRNVDTRCAVDRDVLRDLGRARRVGEIRVRHGRASQCPTR